MKRAVLFAIMGCLMLAAGSANAFGPWSSVSVDADNVTWLGSCPEAQVIANDDGSIDIWFEDSFEVETSTTDYRVNEKCEARIPINYYGNLMCYVSEVGFEGLADVGEGGEAYALLRYRLAGTVGEAAMQSYTEPGVYDVVINKTYTKPTGWPSFCAKTDTLKATIQLYAKQCTAPGCEAEQTYIAVEEGAANVHYTLDCVPCPC